MRVNRIDQRETWSPIILQTWIHPVLCQRPGWLICWIAHFGTEGWCPHRRDLFMHWFTRFSMGSKSIFSSLLNWRSSPYPCSISYIMLQFLLCLWCNALSHHETAVQLLSLNANCWQVTSAPKARPWIGFRRRTWQHLWCHSAVPVIWAEEAGAGDWIEAGTFFIYQFKCMVFSLLMQRYTALVHVQERIKSVVF
jgi:hypothetical protein